MKTRKSSLFSLHHEGKETGNSDMVYVGPPLVSADADNATRLIYFSLERR